MILGIKYIPSRKIINHIPIRVSSKLINHYTRRIGIHFFQTFYSIHPIFILEHRVIS